MRENDHTRKTTAPVASRVTANAASPHSGWPGSVPYAEADVICLLDDVHDAAGRRGPEPADVQEQHDGRLVLDPGVVRHELDARSALRLPAAQCPRRALEDVGSPAELNLGTGRAGSRQARRGPE